MVRIREDVVHDCFIEVFGITPSEEEISNIVNDLPEEINILADQHGWYDTEVGDKICKWIRRGL